MGCPIKGDLKYGAERSNPDGGISLLARRIFFEHPVSHKIIDIIAPVPDEKLWHDLEQIAAARLNNNQQNVEKEEINGLETK